MDIKLGLKGRSILSLKTETPEELLFLLNLSLRLKTEKKQGKEVRRLIGKNIALIFEKSSTRTRCAFEVAIADQGACSSFLTGLQMGSKETVEDTFRVLERMYDAIEYRGSDHKMLEDCSRIIKIPIYNGLTDDYHPTQMLADVLTMKEHCPKPINEISYCFIGDCRFNMANSHLIIASKLGMDIRLISPKSLKPNPKLIEECEGYAKKSGAKITFTENLEEGVKGVDFIHTDVWVSMGEPEAVWEERIKLLKPYQVTIELLKKTGNPYVKFMHCLPAFHNDRTEIGKKIKAKFGLDSMECTDEVFESKASVVFDQSENRMHTIKAILVATLCNDY